LYLQTATCFDVSKHHHHHQGVLLLYRSYMPVTVQYSPAEHTQVLKIYRYQVVNIVDVTVSVTVI